MRLARLACLGTKTVDERLQMLALDLLLLDHFLVEQHALAPLAFEGGITAAIKFQLAAFERQDMPDSAVEQIPVMTDDDQCCRIASQMILQPECAFEIEIVGRLIKQQQVGFCEQGCGQCHAHAPAA